ncbi:MAG: class I SAM-dependent methyltransferase [Thermoleophilaceae bacterium]
MDSQVASANQEAVDAWDGVLFDRFVRYRDLMMDGLAPFGEESYRVCPPEPGSRVLDVGCGFGDSTQRLAELVGAGGEAVGVDSSARFIETARAEAEQAGVANASFAVADVQAGDLGGPYDAVYSRFGTMFFASPVAALRNIREALAPGGCLCMVVWRRKEDNHWVPRAESVVKGMVTEDEDSDELTCGPGPFSMANADTTTAVTLTAGFEHVSLTRCDRRWSLGSMDQAVDLALAIGPAGEAIRLAGEDADRQRPRIVAAVREAFGDLVDGDGVSTNVSTWIVTARAPA